MIGKRMKELRKIKGVSLTELSARSGVQLATLSRIENQKMTGTLESHIEIAKALGVSLPELYENIESPKTAKEAGAQSQEPGADIFRYSDKSSYEILTSKIFNKKMMPILLKIEPNGQTNAEQGKMGSEKFIFVLDGHIKVSVGKDTYTLGPGNTLYFDSSLPHAFSNDNANEPVKILSVSTPVSL